MTITTKVIADSIGTNGKRITTLQLSYHRYIHSEFMTHRMFSRNASSSRAIPTAKLIEQVRNNPVMPVFWGKNQAGMQAREELTGDELAEAKGEWCLAAISAADHAEYMAELGCHKQIVNRILEPFLPINVIVTATEWDNFFELRDHQDAQPEIQELARCMKVAMQESEPEFNGWHLPYIENDKIDCTKYEFDYLAKISASRCARVSYLKHDGTQSTIEEDLTLFDKLVNSKPAHASPVEHQAYFDPARESSRNFKGGWVQFRDVLGV
jgi:hypothetical protein